MTSISLFSVLLSITLGAELPADFTLPPPPGPFVGAAQGPPATRGFAAGAPLVAATYFYWYDVETKAHVIDHDGSDALTEHPPTLEGFSYKNVAWHAEQLADMIAAGIDVALPVYWGLPTTAATWSDEGLPPLVAARERLIKEGKTPPAIGLFYDTSTLQYNNGNYHVDLTTPAGRLWFYGTIRNFFSAIPPRHRATIDGKPLVLLYDCAFAAKVDEKLFPAVREMFRRDFGSDLYLVKMRGWPGKADSEYQWGAALSPQLLDTAAVGPGYDHAAVPGRAPLVRKREDGRFYRYGWERLLAMDAARRPWLVHVETWNEFHEGTEVCHTAEYGRQYIDLTRHYAEMFHARQRIKLGEGVPVPAVVSAAPGKSEGLKLVPQPDGDGPVVEKIVEGRAAWSTTPNRHSPTNRYLYFDADMFFLYDGDEPLEATVEYFDAGPKAFALEYDSSDPQRRGIEQAFRPAGEQKIEGSKTWKEAVFLLPHARFAGRANTCDFRLACTEAELIVSHVTVRRAKDAPAFGAGLPTPPSRGEVGRPRQNAANRVPSMPRSVDQLSPEDPAARAARHRRVAERRAQTIIMVHRGASAFAPENTLEAYAAAMDRGADGCEIDIRRTKDGVLYLMHDDTVDRMLQGQGKVRELTYDELLQMPFRGAAQRQSPCVPTLAAFLALARQRAMLIHLDVKEPDLQDEIAQMFEAADMWDHLVEVNAGNAERLRSHRKVKLRAYKGWFPEGDAATPEAIARFLAQPGDMVFLKGDPAPAVTALGRQSPSPNPGSQNVHAPRRSDGPPPK